MGRLEINHITLPLNTKNIREGMIEALDWMNAITEPAKQTLEEVIRNLDAQTCIFTLPKAKDKAHKVRRSEGLKELLEYDAIRQIKKKTFMLSLYLIWPYPPADLKEVAKMWKSLPATSPQGIYNKSEEAKPNPMDELTDDELAEATEIEEDRDNLSYRDFCKKYGEDCA